MGGGGISQTSVHFLHTNKHPVSVFITVKASSDPILQNLGSNNLQRDVDQRTSRWPDYIPDPVVFVSSGTPVHDHGERIDSFVLNELRLCDLSEDDVCMYVIMEVESVPRKLSAVVSFAVSVKGRVHVQC